ncbi:hypothetical protein IV487_10255 [Enterococcus saccharolyticus]|uniref:V-type ATP synthase subunit G n=1 Tax=Candidatus Enterococcus willemsii TaxID=1857215 RepID=A0ABQ6YWG0_9ENTE|nr:MULTISPECIES: hypothetical protein [Enterococcus]KAF1302048.1 hypothetical protein BAU17_01375 [Enterococcus sp. CU12B]MCD5002843.1 hypothetical protein [Enterococcus saccharolyticus]
MSVDAIQQLIAAENQASELLASAEEELRVQKADSQERLKQFKEQQRTQCEKQQQLLRQTKEAEFQVIREPLMQRTQTEVERLRTISPELREKALKIIMDKVVS